jgi:citrate synthase
VFKKYKVRILNPELRDVSVAPSKKGCINGDRGTLSYCGYDIDALARNCTYPQVAYLLLHDKMPTPAQAKAFEADLLRRMPINIEGFIESHRPYPGSKRRPGTLIKNMVNSLRDEETADMSTPEGQYEAGLKILGAMPTIVAAAYRMTRPGNLEVFQPRDNISYSENLLYMSFGDDRYKLYGKTMDLVLILQAEHGTNVSTTAAVATGSTAAGPYNVISSGFNALEGPLHGGANEETFNMFRKIRTVEEVEPYILGLLEAGKKISGVGHAVYLEFDPRATVLKAYYDEKFLHCGTSEYEHELLIAKEVERVVLENPYLRERKKYPNVDFYSGLVTVEMGYPPDMLTALFMEGRVAGLLGHSLEYNKHYGLMRPCDLYIGKENKKLTEKQKPRVLGKTAAPYNQQFSGASVGTGPG